MAWDSIRKANRSFSCPKEISAGQRVRSFGKPTIVLVDTNLCVFQVSQRWLTRIIVQLLITVKKTLQTFTDPRALGGSQTVPDPRPPQSAKGKKGREFHSKHFAIAVTPCRTHDFSSKEPLMRTVLSMVLLPC